MKILLIQNALYYPSHGGANRANRLILEALAALGHKCHALCSAIGGLGQARDMQSFISDLVKYGITHHQTKESLVDYELNGVRVHNVTTSNHMPRALKTLCDQMSPDCLIVTSEDPFQRMLHTALEVTTRPVVYFAHTTLTLPCGPGSYLPSEARTLLLERTAAVFTISHFIAEYLRRYSSCAPIVIQPPIFEQAPAVERGSCGPRLLMINPCKIKGIDILLTLADKFPSLPFQAVKSWGTTAEDLGALSKRSNIRVVMPKEHIGELFRDGDVLIVPSLWLEGFGMVVVEAMLRGIPVIASNSGGLPEAKCGVDYLIPITPITRYELQLDSNMIPMPITVRTDIEPWVTAVGKLTEDPEHYRMIATESRSAAINYVSQCSIDDLAKRLATLSQ